MRKIILALCLLSGFTAGAANIRFAFTNYLGAPDTNWFYVIPINDVADAGGSFVTRGPAVRLTPNSSGLVTNAFEVGNYMVTNRFLSRGFVFRAPNDHGPTVYCATCATNNTPQGSGLAISGYNSFVTIVYGTNPPPTYDEITNSLGFLPLTGTQVTNAAAYQAKLATNGLAAAAVAAGIGISVATNGTLYTVTATGEGGPATNVIEVAAGSGVTVVTNLLLRTLIVTNVTGTFTGNAAGLTNYGGPEILLNPIRVGFGTQPYGPNIHPSDFFLAIAPGTAGVITKVEIQPDLSAGTHSYPNEWNDINLQIFPDCGSFTNNASLTNPAVNVPLADLFNNRFKYTTNGHWAVERKSRFIDSQDWSTNLLYGGPIHLLWFYAPIYASNGCVIRLQSNLGNTNWGHGYIGATVDNRANLDQLGRFASWRLRSHNVNGAFTGGSASNYLTTVSSAGLLIGWTVGAFDNTESGNVVSWTDSRGLQVYSGSGERWNCFTDDILGSTYAGSGGFHFGPEVGLLTAWMGPNLNGASQAIEGYRWFGESGMYWTNSAVFSLSGNAAFPSLVGYSSTLLYYAP